MVMVCMAFGVLAAPVAEGEQMLPDGRAWELVSPPVKDGALIPPISEDLGLLQAAEGGNAMTYPSVGPAKSEQEEAPLGNANATQILSVRGADGGWLSQDIATPYEAATGVSVGAGQEYKWFSPDLSVGLVEPLANNGGAPPLSAGASEKTIYLRADAPLAPTPSEEEVYAKATAEEGYGPLVTSKTGHANVPAGTVFGGQLAFAGANTGLSGVVFNSAVPLTEEATGEGLYEWTPGEPEGEPDGRLQLVSLLPDVPPYDGRPASGGGFLGFRSRDIRNAVSDDGSRVIWSGAGHLFMRDMINGQTVQLDQAGVKEGVFQFASGNGRDVFFTDESALVAGSHAATNRPDLYECEMQEKEEGGRETLECRVKDLTVDSTEAADVLNVVLVGSEESSYLYFVATGVLTSEENTTRKEKAKAGADNLYMLHYNAELEEWEEPTFIAGLSPEDERDWGEPNFGDLEPVTSRVSPDGEYFAFMSDRSLTGFDNVDVNSSAEDEELYLYQAPSSGLPAGRLVCVSCNPSGMPPSGVLDSTKANEGAGLLVDQQKLWNEGRWLAAAVPGWETTSLGEASYQSRYLLDDGRVFFDSPDALVPQATNGVMDVYEYEPLSVSGCTETSMTFDASAEGCVDLISSGSAGEESAFVDASASGHDVFFVTSAQLVSEDRDTAFDVYDAHVCSTSAPCAANVTASPPCREAESCRAAPSGEPSIYGAPPSVTFTGPGNPAQPNPVVVTKKCPKGRRLSNGKCVKPKRKAKRPRRVGIGKADRGHGGAR
ncbi:MAG TPA: hypothetical protein VG147_15105 [Solirubrobacteraceae bacterium]|nr:hypothetical protein [Solirubrobacteraceae bacterium]